MGENIQGNLPQRKIKIGVQFGINAVPTRVPTDEESSLDRIALKHFPYHPHLRILSMERIGKIANESARHVLNRVMANSIDNRGADPTSRVQHFGARNLRLL